MINQAMDFIFTDSLAFAINATLGTIVRTKLCNYSWEQRIKTEPPTKESGDRQETTDLQTTDANYSQTI